MAARPYSEAVSIMLAEHIRRPWDFHRNVLRLLRPGGTAFHFYPTLYSLPFVVNRLLPEDLSRRLLGALKPGRDSSGNYGKFHAYYRWCRGPTPRQLKNLERVGFRVEEYHGFFGHSYYRRIGRLQALEDGLASVLLKHSNPWLTSYAYVILGNPQRVSSRREPVSVTLSALSPTGHRVGDC